VAEAPKNVWEALGFAWEFGFMIALPLVAFGGAGKYFDSKWGTAPALALTGVGLAIVVSSFWIYRHLKPLLR
jgi:hypothetical protein